MLRIGVVSNFSKTDTSIISILQWCPFISYSGKRRVDENDQQSS